MKKVLNELYIVEENDTLDGIAAKYNISFLSILLQNNILPKMIKKGKVLFIKRKIN